MNVHGDATILDTESLSGAIECNDHDIVGIFIPASWTTAQISFSVCYESSGTYVPAYDAAGVELVCEAASSRYIAIPPDALAGARFVKIRSGTVGLPVAQSGDITLKIALSTDQ